MTDSPLRSLAFQWLDPHLGEHLTHAIHGKAVEAFAQECYRLGYEAAIIGEKPPELLTIADVLRMLSITYTTYYRLVEEGVFHPFRITKGLVRIWRSEVDALMAQGRRKEQER